MTILSFSEEGEYIRIVTDNPGRPVFVYEKDRFATREQLEREIEKSIAHEAARKMRKEIRKENLKAELSRAGVKDDTLLNIDEL